jgi:hypothetical protein
MATVTGQRGTGNVSSDQRDIDMAEAISLLRPTAQPLTVLSKRASQMATGDPKFQWEEDDREPRFDAVNDATPPNAAATAVTVDNGAYFAQHDLVIVTRTGEMFRVNAVSGNDLTDITRGVGSTAADFADNDELYIISSAQPAGDTSKPARSSNPTNVYNYTQIFRKPWDATGTWRASRNKTRPKDWNHQAKKAGIEHAIEIELAFLFGYRSEDTSGSQPRRTTKGAIRYITTNVQDAGGTLTETEWSTFMRTANEYTTGSNKLLIASRLILSVLNDFAQGKLETRQGESTYGLAVTRYVTPHGSVDVVPHPELRGAVYGGYAVLLDMDEVKYRYLANEEENRNTHIRENIQERDRDGRKDEMLTEAGLQFGLEKRHGLLTGITG